MILILFVGQIAGDEHMDGRDHWAFQPPERPAVPDVSAAWIRNDIDRFIAAEHKRRGLTAVREAPRSALLRRVYLDLIGLPPARDDLHAFLNDASPNAYERVVDRLLDRRHYGERWARHWMDVWRYSDPSGFGKEVRDSRQHIWRWRDWIIDSINADTGYDRLIVEMLAADEVAPQKYDALRATGYLARNWYKFNRNVWLDNIVEHSSKAFLGLTLNCARCHEHKYDPIGQDEYYRMRAIFEPHDVRDDLLPDDKSARMQEGAESTVFLVRAFDANAETPTYPFIQGHELRPDKEHPVTPAVPSALGGKLEIEPIELPLTAYYPALRPEHQKAALAKADAEIDKARAGMVEAERALEESKLKSEPGSTAASAQTNVEIARLYLAAAEPQRASLVARYAAEREKYGLESGDTKQLAQAASRAERLATVRRLEEQVARDRQRLAEAEQTPAEDEDKSQEAAEKAQKDLATHTEELAEAQAKLASDSLTYSPVGEIYPKTSTGRRLALARWITDRQNPLAARVAVNHIWLRRFGAPLVERMDNFGLQSPRPQHAELLDWLAVQFMEDGWSMKRLHRLMVTSGAYRLSSSATVARHRRRDGQPASTTKRSAYEGNRKIDPDNQMLWRRNALRMDAEVVRDSLLYVSGSLDMTMGGPPIDHDQGQTVLRRSIYFRQDKERQMTFLILFDGAKVNECYRRKATVAPQQALAMFNSQITADQARKIAANLPHETDQQFVTALFEQVVCRTPTSQELSECVAFLRDLPEKNRARQQLALVLLNHNDFVTIR